MQKKSGSPSREVATLLLSFLLGIFFLLRPAGASGKILQGALEQRISVSFGEESLHAAIRKIERVSRVRFAYNSKDLRGYAVHSQSYAQKPLRLILTDLLLATSLNLKEINETIVITRVEEKKALPSASRAGGPGTSLSAVSVAEEIVVQGQVTDHRGNALPGVNILLKGTSRGITSGTDGRFVLRVDSPEQTLIFSFVGYKTQEIPLAGRTTLTVTLREDVSRLEEVVVVGYGTQKKSDLTGAVGTVQIEKTLMSRPATNVQELLAGSVPGLNISKSSGAVGSGASLNIRGTSTIGNSSGVLVLIDGMPGNVYTLNPNDIENISVLKDAASAAIYGSRAANGVLLITTKQGKTAGKPVVELNAGVGIQQPQFRLDFVGADQFMKLWDQALVNDGKQPLYGDKGLQDLKDGKYPDNKWYKAIYRKNTLISNNSLAVSGGTESVTYRLSGSYDYQDGTLPNNNYKKYILRPDITVKLSPKLSLGARIQYTETYIHQPQGGTTQWQSESSRASPISPIYTKNGQYGLGSSMVGNPIAAVHQGGYYDERYKEIFSVFDANYTLAKNWTVNGRFSRYTSDMWSDSRVLRYNLYDDAGNIAAQKNLVTSLTSATTGSYRNMLQVTSDYSLTLGRHFFKALAGYSQEYYKTSGFSAFRDNMPFDAVDVLDVGASTNMQNTGTASDVAIQSVFGRVNYDYDGRYLLQANVRGDGSSRFARNYRWGVFPSFSAGWNIHREAFFRTGLISQLKLRASWGLLGDAEKVGNYATAQVLSYNPQIYGFNGVVVPGAYNAVAINPRISWERAQQTNVGLDAGLWGQRITLSVDYFFNKRDKILYQAPAPAEFGLTAPFSNLLKMNNTGWEFAVGYRDGYRDFHWTADATLGFSKNKITDLAGTGPWKGSSTFSDVGSQYNLPYGLQAVGLFQTAEEIKNAPGQGANVFPGNIRFKDQNNDNKIDGNDMVVLNTRIPVRVGLNLSASWKNLDISANGYGVFNTMRYMSGYEGWAFYLSQNARPIALDNWTPSNPDAGYPRLSIQYTANDTRYSSFWLRTADYFKIQNVQVGYVLSQEALKALKMKYLRLYLSGQNLAMISHYPGFDPEGSWYPLARTYSFGVNVKF